ncbi:hypothetical protein Q5P01_011231 [Channa striata]|uniref:Protein DBF4 homolog A n=1 Tax=Channa striata TaxID=64152 RepID=A0AA88SQG6_CHASR|nr:hypothetical protein Q5P01_011231 [Channa striata]
MKPKRSQKHTGNQWTGKGVTTGDKTTLSHPKSTSRASCSGQVKPLAGKVFYLDLPSNKTAETLECDIKELGGTVEKFFSKEIKYLVSNKKEAQYARCLKQDSPVPSPDSGQSSPQTHSNPHHPVSNRDKIKSRSQGQADALVTSRGKSLVERVVKEQERVKMNKILSNALEWGVKILYVDDVIAYVHKKKKIFNSQCPVSTSTKTRVKAEAAAEQGLKKCKSGRISRPFIKVEDSSRHYRPIYLTMPQMPEFSLRTVPPCSPFCVTDKDPPGNNQQTHRGAKASAGEERAHGQKKNRDKKRGGYCECCMIKYENLKTHLHSERHQAFSKSDEYLVVDRLVSAMRCNLIHIKANVKRPKCSVSSVLVAPGPCRKVKLRHIGDIDNNKTNKQEQQCTVIGDEGTSSQHVFKNKSHSGSAPHTYKEGDRKICCTHSDTFKHKSVPRKHSSRHNCLTSCTQKAEQAQKLSLKTQKASSSGECTAFYPSMVTQVDLTDQISLKGVNSSTSVFCSMTVKSELVSNSVMTNQNEVCDPHKDSSLFEAVQDGDILPQKNTGNTSEKEEGSCSTQSLSPIRKISRKLRVYKRKRRRIDTQLEHLKPNNVPDNSIQRLWELFQSSDDMDEEFYGFEDQEETNELRD